ncbi:MAG TPA: MBL fold metallo-hydrolase [Patescibacteria group bacterium]|nr:MBL fold metallo-hydrolase [Patescibacteria group bacterium]
MLAVLAGGILVYIYIQSSRHEFKVTFFDIGQGDAFLIEFETGEQMLVDCGKDKKILSKLGSALPFYDRTIDYLLITHYDSDHYGGCADVLRRYRVLKVVDNGLKKPGDPYFDSFEIYREKEKASYEAGHADLSWRIGEEVINFFGPGTDYGLDSTDHNENSLVFKLSRKDKDWLFMGDAGVKLEEAILRKYCSEGATCPLKDVEVLKAGHHGSDTSSSEEFLEVVSPEEAVISVGKNSFGHPSLRVLRKLDRVGANILRTDLDRDIIYR